MIRTYKRKLNLTKAQEQHLRRWVGVCRLVYNMGMEIKNTTYKATGKSVNKFALMKQITELRAETDWVRDVPVSGLQQTMSRLDNCYNIFFRTFKNGGGFPKFASKKTYGSVTLIQNRGLIKVIGNKINVQKIGWLKMFKDSPVIGDIKNATIKIEPTGFFICIQCGNVPAKFISENQTIGLDMGLSHFAVDSNGEFIKNPKHFKKYEAKLRIENRSLARKKKGGNSWKRQAKRLALLHHKIGNVRKDFLHKESTKIAKANSTVYMEKLNIKGMSKNGNLAKHILDCGWGSFRIMVEYKTTLVKVDPKYTSQICNECGEKDAKSRISQSKFICTSCGMEANADINAAKNILSRGVALGRQREPIGCALTLIPIITGTSEAGINNYNYGRQ